MTRSPDADPVGHDPHLEALAAERAAGLEFIHGQVEWLALDELEPHPENPNEGDVGAISASIDRTGFYGLVLVQSADRAPNGRARILVGEHRWLALGQRGAKRVPCYVMDVDDATARRILLDNEFTRRGRSVPDRLIPLLDAVALEPDGLAGTPYDPEDLDALHREAEQTLSEALAGGAPASVDPPMPRGPMGAHATCPNCGHRFALGAGS